MTRRDKSRRRQLVPPSASLPPPRDPNLAVREEYDLALAQGSDEALARFVARHPKHPLVKQALLALERLRASRSQ